MNYFEQGHDPYDVRCHRALDTIAREVRDLTTRRDLTREQLETLCHDAETLATGMTRLRRNADRIAAVLGQEAAR